jgi:hypothetical protein
MGIKCVVFSKTDAIGAYTCAMFSGVPTVKMMRRSATGGSDPSSSPVRCHQHQQQQQQLLLSVNAPTTKEDSHHHLHHSGSPDQMVVIQLSPAAAVMGQDQDEDADVPEEDDGESEVYLVKTSSSSPNLHDGAGSPGQPDPSLTDGGSKTKKKPSRRADRPQPLRQAAGGQNDADPLPPLPVDIVEVTSPTRGLRTRLRPFRRPNVEAGEHYEGVCVCDFKGVSIEKRLSGGFIFAVKFGDCCREHEFFLCF